ncbi:mitochondrial peripheral inner membrane protein [Lambiella insularis]|nr:mitochondrial peripheral inner membrane protein [Lambiella insularis]
MSSTSSIFTFIPISKPAGNDIHDAAWREGVWSVQIRQPQLQIARAYTPLPPIAGIGDDSISSALRFLIRQDPNGEVSGYLHKLPQGAIIDLRGPHIEYNVPADVYEVLFLAGGTGIAPALQVAHALYHMRKEAVVDPKMHILLANRRREDCAGGISDTQSKASSWLGAWISTDTSRPVSSASSVVSKDMVFSPLVQYLEQLKLKQGGQLSVDYFVDEERTFINQEILRRQLQSNSDPAAPQSKGKRLILVSGPDGFVEYLAGPKVWQNGKELQGPLGGLLGQMKISGWEVWKL